jgi:formate hydrogenlyase transcriptional activator
LVRYFVAKYAARMDRQIETIPTETMQALERWSWPGNVRELENLMERAVILTRGPVLQVPLGELQSLEVLEPENGEMSLHDAERSYIVKALRDAKGQISGMDGAAARLGLKRTTLQSKIKKLGIERREYS